MSKPCKKLHSLFCVTCQTKDGSLNTATVHVRFADGSCGVYCFSKEDPWVEHYTQDHESDTEVESILAYCLGYQGELEGIMEIVPDHRWHTLNEH